MAQPSHPLVIANGSKGLQVTTGCPPFRVLHQLTDRSVRCLQVSNDGKYLMWPTAADTNSSLNIMDLEKGEVAQRIPLSNAPQFLKISPKATSVATWFPFKSCKAGEEETPNLLIYDVASGQLKGNIICKKMSKWEPEWTEDESICARLSNTELMFYEKDKFDRWVNKMETQKTVNFALATNTRNGQTYVACYSGPGSKGQASFVRIYRYPNLGNAIVNKSFFKADNVNFMWSPRGDCLLFLCVSDVDKSGKSYYGEQKLNFMEASGSGGSYIVSLKKEGPIHAVAWIPDLSQPPSYIVIYGYIPARVSIFDLKGGIIFDFNSTEMKVNQIVFNPFGNIVALVGFGNLRGTVSVWDLRKKKQISEFQCPETTDIAFSPDGKSLMTATTAPRLRVGNGWKWYTISGAPLLDNTFAINVELYNIMWQPRPGAYEPPVFATDFKPVTKTEATANRYIPPSRRTQADQERVKMEDIKKTDPAKEKLIQSLTRKLTDIGKLKQRQSLGAELKAQQIETISQENQIRRQLEQLKL